LACIKNLTLLQLGSLDGNTCQEVMRKHIITNYQGFISNIVVVVATQLVQEMSKTPTLSQLMPNQPT
jgi:hypothetical protein